MAGTPIELLHNAIQDIRVSGAVVLIGAGASFRAGMPLAGQLAPLVWHTLDSDRAALLAVSRAIGVEPTSGKRVVGDAENRIWQAFEHIQLSPLARRIFQESVVAVNREVPASASASHSSLARLIFNKVVIGVVSLNWDTLLESAFQHQYGFDLTKSFGSLWKPHGDCAAVEGNWVLPHQPGSVPDELATAVNSLALNRPRTLLIVGYSERDEVVVDRLIAPLQSSWRTYRIGPAAVGEGAIRIDAGEALKAVEDALAPNSGLHGWRPVHFGNQRGIEAAIQGARLGPQDVLACSRLPQFDDALQSLTSLNSLQIMGPSGSGKSITAWQLAHVLSEEGWLVVRHDRDASLPESLRLEALRDSKWPTVAVIDDMQTLPTSLAADCSAISHSRLRIILGTTTELDASASIRIAEGAAVKAIAQTYTSRRAEVLEIVSKSDSSVGDGFLQERIEERILRAANARSPWLFNYIVRRGWSQTKKSLELVSDALNSDIALVLIAARQLLSLDAGCTLAELGSDATQLGRATPWIESAIRNLSSMKLIEVEETVRCLHLLSAAEILECFTKSRDSVQYPELVGMLRRVMLEQSTPLRGVSWFLSRSYSWRTSILDMAMSAELCARLFNSSAGVERAEACPLISAILAREGEIANFVVGQYGASLLNWAEEVSGADARAIGNVMSTLSQSSCPEASVLPGRVDPVVVARKVARSSLKDSLNWGVFLGRIANAVDDSWRQKCAAAVPRNEVIATCAAHSVNELDDLCVYINGISQISVEMSLDCINACIDTFQESMRENVLKAYQALDDLEGWALGHPFFGNRVPSARQARTTRAIFDGICPDRASREVVSARFGDWEMYARLFGWMARAHTRKLKAVSQAINLSELSNAIGCMWRDPPREVNLLLGSLVVPKHRESHERIAQWIAEHSERIESIGPILTLISPQAAIAVLRRGARVRLDGHNRSDWILQLHAVKMVSRVDQIAAQEVLVQNRDHLIRAVEELVLPSGLPELLQYVHEIDGSLLHEVCCSIRVAECERNWQKALRDGRRVERMAARGVLRIVSRTECGGVALMAGKLLDRAGRRPRERDV